MSQAGTVTRLAVRELWMTFRLLLVLFAWVAAGAVAGLVPGAPTVILARLAIGLGAATILSAVTAAWSMGAERAAGRAGWLVTRSVDRGTYLVGWYLAVTTVSLVGLLLAASLGWLSVTGALGPGAGMAFAAAMLGVATTTLAAIALGLLAGALLRPPLAAAVTVLGCAALATAALVADAGVAGVVPGAGHVLVARAGTESIVGDALRAAGIGLALAGVLLVLARVALERTEL
jgi:hypothetical protein